MNSSLKNVFTTILLLSFGLAAKAQTDSLNIVTSAVPFLRISPDARAGGMGDVGIATTPDANANFWNLAKIPYIKSPYGFSATYTPWLKDLGLNDVYLASMSGYYKLDEESSIAGAMRYFSLGNIQFTDANGADLNQFRPHEFGIDFGYARKLSPNFSIGVGARFISSSLANGATGTGGVIYKTGTAIAGDISLYKSPSSEDGAGLSWGLVLSNLGSKIGYTNDALNKDYIPANMGIGVGYTYFFDESNKITYALDVNKLLVPAPPVRTGDETIDAAALTDYRSKSIIKSWFSSFGGSGGFGNELRKLQVSAGAEYVYNDQFAIRAGYFYEDRTQGNRKYFTAGVGLKYSTIGINFSYLVPSGNGVTRNPLSNTLRFGLTFDFDDVAK